MKHSETQKRVGSLVKADIVEAIYEQSAKPREECKKAVENLLNIMTGAIAKDHEMLLSGFGKFECYPKKPRRGRNPKTSETLIIDARKVIVFRLSRGLRAELNKQI